MAALPEDVRKMGFLKKLKTMKSKLFVLREATTAHDARLEYYDSDKKFKKGAPKRAISLKKCFSINKKLGARKCFTIALYTKDDCFAVVCENEEEQEEWLRSMLELRCGKEGDESPPLFEHLWPVTVREKGLTSTGAVSPGAHRLCLTNTELKLVKVCQDHEDVDFQLASIRRCGNTDNFFFMEVGRSAKTGEGELWMQVEDAMIAKSMHEVIRGAMKSSKLEQEPPPTMHQQRTRSSSSVDPRHRPRHSKVPSRQASVHGSVGYESSTLPLIRQKPTPTVTMTDDQRSPLARRHSHSPNKGASNQLSLAHSPLGGGVHPFSFLGDIRTRTDSMESRGSRGTTSSLSAEELDTVHPDHQHSSGGGSTRSVTPDGPIEEEPDPYLSMTPGGSTPKWARDITSSSLDSSNQSYLSMTPGMTPNTTPGSSHGSGHSTPQSGSKHSVDGGASYMEMSLALPPTPPDSQSAYMNMSQTSGSASSTTSSTHEMDESSYLDMKPCSQSLPKSQTRLGGIDGGYLAMTYGYSPRPSNSSSSSSVRLEPVRSFLQDDSSQDGPRRAYSVGSKPMAMLSKPQHDSFNDTVSLERVQSKSCSAPHLPDKDKHPPPHPHPPPHSAMPVDRHGDELFMEMDFKDHKPEDDEFRGRTHSGGSHDFRSRTSSGGSKDFRPRTSSFGTCERMRAGSFGGRDAIKKSIEGHRPRTATICQDSLRERTSSFGPADNMRPRSSSYGNARFRELRKLGRDPNRSNSNEALRRGANRTPSQDSLKRSQRMIGNDLKKLTSSSRQKSQEYMDMTRGSNDSVHKQDYVQMTNPTVPSPSSSPSLSRFVSFNIHRDKPSQSDDYAFIQPVVGSPVTTPENKGSDYCLMEATGQDYMMMAIEKPPGGARSPLTTSSQLQQPSSHAPHSHSTTSQQQQQQQGKLSTPTSSSSKDKNVVLQGSPKSGPRSAKDKVAPPARSAGKATGTGDKPWSAAPTMQNVPEESGSGEYVEIGFVPKDVKTETISTSTTSKGKQTSAASSAPVPAPLPATAYVTADVKEEPKPKDQKADSSYVVYSPASNASSSSNPPSASGGGRLEKVRSPLRVEEDGAAPNKIKKSSFSPFPELGSVQRAKAASEAKHDAYADMDFTPKPLSVDVSDPHNKPAQGASSSSPGVATGLCNQLSPGGATGTGTNQQLSPRGGDMKKHSLGGATGTGISTQNSSGSAVGTGTSSQLSPRGATGTGTNKRSPRRSRTGTQQSPGGAASLKQHSPGGASSRHQSSGASAAFAEPAKRGVPIPSTPSAGSGLSLQMNKQKSASSDEGDYMQVSPPVKPNPVQPSRKTAPPVPKPPPTKPTAPPVSKPLSEKEKKERRSSTGSYGGSCKQGAPKPSAVSSAAASASPASANTLTIWSQSKITSRGSTGSLATLNEHQNLSKMTSRGSAGSLTGMDVPGNHPSNAQQNTTEQQLNYATLELVPGNQPPINAPPGLNNSSAVNVVNNQGTEAPMEYAQIDFSKSVEPSNTKNCNNSTLKENRLSFS